MFTPDYVPGVMDGKELKGMYSMLFHYFTTSIGAVAFGSVTAAGITLLYIFSINQQALVGKNRQNKIFLYGFGVFILCMGISFSVLGLLIVEKYTSAFEDVYIAVYVVTFFLFTLNVMRLRRKKRDEIH
jgi:hypothetical protein